MLNYCNDVGLLAEEVDLATGGFSATSRKACPIWP
jgi:hypothetical protein